MLLENYEMNLPSYSIGNQVYEKIGKICRPYGTKAVIIGGKKAMHAASEKIKKSAAEGGIDIIDALWFGTDCTYGNIERLRAERAYAEADMVFAVGGGKAMDTCKCLCTQDDKPVFTFPTIASNCSGCTTVSVMYNDDGTFLKPHFYLNPPNHAFIDTQILAEAPERYLWAGIGDTYTKYYESTISSRNEQLQHFTALGVNVSRMCLDPLVQYGPKGLDDNRKHSATYEFEQTVLAVIVTTAIASIFLTRDFTPDYNSGLAHAVFYALTTYPVIEHEHLHGEVVSFGALLALICDGQLEEFEKIFRLNKSLGLPTSLSDIGISSEEFDEAIDRIPDLGDLAHYPYRVTRPMLEDALQVLERANEECCISAEK